MTITESSLIQKIPIVGNILEARDHFDVSSIACDKSLLLFKDKLVSYHPGWIKALYKVREFFLKILKIPQVKDFEPMYITVATDDSSFWIGVISDTHLTAHLGVMKESKTDSTPVFHVFSIVHFHSYKGKFYFSIIRPFHHFVVYFMMRSAKQEE